MSAAPAVAQGGGDGGEDSGVDPLARTVFALLVLACFGAFFLTQRLKHTPTVVQRFQLNPSFSPYPAGRLKEEGISFKLAHADDVSVAIIDTSGNVVATLVKDRPVQSYKQLSLRWDGRRGSPHGVRVTYTANGHAIFEPLNHGRLASPGEYRVRISLRRQNRPVLSPRSFTLLSR